MIAITFIDIKSNVSWNWEQKETLKLEIGKGGIKHNFPIEDLWKTIHIMQVEVKMMHQKIPETTIACDELGELKHQIYWVTQVTAEDIENDETAARNERIDFVAVVWLLAGIS